MMDEQDDVDHDDVDHDEEEEEEPSATLRSLPQSK